MARRSALARHGDAERLLQALALVNPIGVTERFPNARPRQSTCYYSSSDAAFTDRYQAADHYGEVMAGTVPLEGGWRVYSSRPGIFLRLVVGCLLGVRRRGDLVEIDPVLTTHCQIPTVPPGGRRPGAVRAGLNASGPNHLEIQVS